jgi:CRP/FNR family transcriptional regulator, cyclic AMP receptor protein
VEFSELVQLKQNFPFLRSLTVEELEDLLRAARVRIYREGQIVFREGDIPDGMYIVLMGALKVEKRLEQGDQLVLSKLSSGDIFGEMGLIEYKPRSASVVASTESTLFYIESRGFDEMRRRFHPAAMKILKQLCGILANRVIRMDGILDDFFDNPEKSLEFLEERYLKFVGHPATDD